MVHDPPGSGGLELPDDWADQITRAYEVFGSEEFAKRRITPKMRAAWARMRRRGSGSGGGQWMPNIVAKIPLPEPVVILPPPLELEPEPPLIVVEREEEDEDEELLPILAGIRIPPRPVIPRPPRPPRLPVPVEQPPELPDDDWQIQMFRAYAVFGMDSLGGATEFFRRPPNLSTADRKKIAEEHFIHDPITGRWVETPDIRARVGLRKGQPIPTEPVPRLAAYEAWQKDYQAWYSQYYGLNLPERQSGIPHDLTAVGNWNKMHDDWMANYEQWYDANIHHWAPRDPEKPSEPVVDPERVPKPELPPTKVPKDPPKPAPAPTEQSGGPPSQPRPQPKPKYPGSEGPPQQPRPQPKPKYPGSEDALVPGPNPQPRPGAEDDRAPRVTPKPEPREKTKPEPPREKTKPDPENTQPLPRETTKPQPGLEETQPKPREKTQPDLVELQRQLEERDKQKREKTKPDPGLEETKPPLETTKPNPENTQPLPQEKTKPEPPSEETQPVSPPSEETQPSKPQEATQPTSPPSEETQPAKPPQENTQPTPPPEKIPTDEVNLPEAGKDAEPEPYDEEAEYERRDAEINAANARVTDDPTTATTPGAVGTVFRGVTAEQLREQYPELFEQLTAAMELPDDVSEMGRYFDVGEEVLRTLNDGTGGAHRGGGLGRHWSAKKTLADKIAAGDGFTIQAEYFPESLENDPKAIEYVAGENEVTLQPAARLVVTGLLNGDGTNLLREPVEINPDTPAPGQGGDRFTPEEMARHTTLKNKAAAPGENIEKLSPEGRAAGEIARLYKNGDIEAARDLLNQTAPPKPPQAGGFSDSQRNALQSAKSKTEPPPGWEAKKVNVGATEPHIWENKETGERMIVKDAGTKVWENIEGEELASEIFRESILPNSPEVMLNEDRTVVGASFIGDREDVTSYSTYKEMPFEEQRAILKDLENPDDIISLVISDLAIGNRDRNPGNIMFARKEDGSLEMIPIDHGWTFKEMPENFDGLLYSWTDERATANAKIRDVALDLMLQQVSDMVEGGASEEEIMAYVEGVYDKTIQQLKAVKPTKGRPEDRAMFAKNLAHLSSPEGKKMFMDRISLASKEYAQHPFDISEVARKRAEELNKANGSEEKTEVIKDAANTRTSGMDELNLPEAPDPALEAQASDAHDKFRDGFLLPDGSREVRMRKANPKDPNDETMVDINNTPYEDLPEHWKEQNRASGRSAKNAIEKVEADTGEPFDINNPEHMEAAASDVHDAWLEANSWRDDIPEGQQGPYEGMTEEEKEKDRIFVRETQGYRDRAKAQTSGGAEELNPAIELGASKAHDEYRNGFMLPDGTREVRMRSVNPKDPNETRMVDINNTPYEDLPEHWKEQNRGGARGAENAVQAVEKETGEPFDPSNPEHMEAAAEAVHVDWLERNSWRDDIPEDQQKVYGKMTEANKELDRGFVRNALKNRDLAAEAAEVAPLVIPSNPEEMAGLKGNLSRQLKAASGAKASALKAQIAQLDRALEAAKKK